MCCGSFRRCTERARRWAPRHEPRAGRATGLLGRRLELLRALHARGPALARADLGHLRAGLVDHLVAEHDRAAQATGLRGVTRRRAEEKHGVVVGLLAGPI